MQKICNVLSKIILLLGSVGSIIVAVVFGKETTVTLYGITNTERNWGVTIGILLVSLVSVFLLYVIFAAFSEILENQEHILYNQSKYMDRKNKAKKQAAITPTEDDTWICPQCGTPNLPTQRECKDCGYER